MAHKAYGEQHKRTRTKLLRELPTADPKLPSPEGKLCPRCGREMRPWEPLDLGHTREADKRAGLPGDRLEHAVCNREAGASRKIEPGSTYRPSEDW